MTIQEIRGFIGPIQQFMTEEEAKAMLRVIPGVTQEEVEEAIRYAKATAAVWNSSEKAKVGEGKTWRRA